MKLISYALLTAVLTAGCSQSKTAGGSDHMNRFATRATTTGSHIPRGDDVPIGSGTLNADQASNGSIGNMSGSSAGGAGGGGR